MWLIAIFSHPGPGQNHRVLDFHQSANAAADTGRVRERREKMMDDIVSDSLEARRKLVATGLSELQANTVADTLHGFRKGLATKADIREIRLNFRDVRMDIRELSDTVGRMATKQALDDLRTSTEQGFADLRQEMRQDMADQKDELKQDMRRQRMTDRWMFAMLWASMLASNTVLFYAIR